MPIAIRNRLRFNKTFPDFLPIYNVNSSICLDIYVYSCYYYERFMKLEFKGVFKI